MIVGKDGEIAEDSSSVAEAPPAYETISTSDANAVLEKRYRPVPPTTEDRSLPKTPMSAAGTSSTKSSWSLLGIAAKDSQARTAAEVRVSVHGLIRHLIKGPAGSETGIDVDADLAYAYGLLDSCRTTCLAHGISFQDVLQDRSIEGHTPLYWAILRRPRRRKLSSTPSSSQSLPKDDLSRNSVFIMYLITLSSPLSLSTQSDIRHACIAASDPALFQLLRHNPLTGLAAAHPKDAMLLGFAQCDAGCDDPLSPTGADSKADKGSAKSKGKEWVIPDRIVMHDDSPGDGPFVAHVELRMFQTRMRVSGEVKIEFIARGRIWILAFFTVPSTPSQHNNIASSSSPTTSDSTRHYRSFPPSSAYSHLSPGAWAVALGLGEHSPPTWVDARIVVETAPPPPLPKTEPQELLIDAPIPDMRDPAQMEDSRQQQQSRWSLRGKEKETAPAPIVVRLKCRYQLTAEPSPPSTPNSSPATSPSSHRREARRHADRFDDAGHDRSVAVAALDESPVGGKLQYDGNPYISADGTLRARLEARLTMPESDCVIC
ncbi:hypothetical protein BD410DRAFT_796829 [Rickenella mellea]|uniref:Uncharacterized protein n=1 Tax=Rickenella mellea TaxID=50990 RepID=A0A4Y7PIS9_9AGAM|nr:hypothetical protein BD410DRAFT_796829 [Rickenella mellea]